MSCECKGPESFPLDCLKEIYEVVRSADVSRWREVLGHACCLGLYVSEIGGVSPIGDNDPSEDDTLAEVGGYIEAQEHNVSQGLLSPTVIIALIRLFFQLRGGK